MERLIHHDHARTVLVSHLHTGVHRIVGHRRAQFFVAVPGLHGIEGCGQHFDLGARHATAHGRTEQVVEGQGLQGVVGLDPMPAGLLCEFRSLRRLFSGGTALFKGRLHNLFVQAKGHDEFDGHY